jgi:hypothetical protein
MPPIVIIAPPPDEPVSKGLIVAEPDDPTRLRSSRCPSPSFAFVGMTPVHPRHGRCCRVRHATDSSRLQLQRP